MTSTSFNPIQIQQTTVQQSQSLTLKQGQVFHGTIKKLYPDQMAEIQIGQHKLFAKLETPLKVGDSHFFQVSNMNLQAELKVVTGPMQQSYASLQQLNQLLDTMNLPKTIEMQQLVAHFVKNQMPISKEQLIQAEIWLKNLPEATTKQEALQVIQKMVELKMPFTNELFKGLIFGSKTSGISVALENLSNILAQNQTLSSSVKSNLLQQLQLISKPFDIENGGVLLSKATQTLLNQSEPVLTKSQVLNLLKSIELLPKSATIENWLAQSFQQNKVPTNDLLKQFASQQIQLVANAKPTEVTQMLSQVQSWITNQNLLNNEQKIQMQQFINRFESLPKNPATIELFAKQLHEQMVKAFSENTKGLFTSDQNGLSTKDQLISLLKPEAAMNTQSTLLNLVQKASVASDPTIQVMGMQADAEVLAALDSKAMEQALKTILKSLGVSYEASLNSKAADIHEVAQALKPQLLSLIQDAQTPAVLRDSAENIISRLNGMQLLSGENGHQHQLVMQVPLQFLSKQTEATIQWNGRMKKDGKIDSNYARILFYLNMEAIQETVVDMQVQNRIITINLYNDHPNLEFIAEPLKESLKKGLLEKNYQLSGLVIKPFEKTVVQNVKENSINRTNQSKFQDGVDIWI